MLHWFVQMALGLHYMHANRVLHRDLKTQNIFLLGNGRLVLGDLGISKVLEGTLDFAQTRAAAPVRTWRYDFPRRATMATTTSALAGVGPLTFPIAASTQASRVPMRLARAILFGTIGRQRRRRHLQARWQAQ